MIKMDSKGTFSKTFKYLEGMKDRILKTPLDKYGQMGVDALAAATPIDTAETALSWNYEIIQEPGKVKLVFNNSHVENHVNIAVILQYGHATRNGGWVEGRDYINPAIQPIFDELADKMWKEVTK